MAKIAVIANAREAQGAGGARPPRVRTLAAGGDWSVCDVVCSAGPKDPPFEEQHSRTSIAFVLSGTFQYRTSTGDGLMLPGSLLLGNAGDGFRCGHDHGAGDRCVAFFYESDLFQRLADEAGAADKRFHTPRLPPLRLLAGLAARAGALLDGECFEGAEELSIETAGWAACVSNGLARRPSAADAASLARITRVARRIENDADAPCGLEHLAAEARLSRYHFLRLFRAVTGVTPRQFILRTRLRRAAVRLRADDQKIAEVALDCGFGDISHFNRTFRAEFGLSPRAYRKA